MYPLQLELLAQHALRHEALREAAHLRLIKAARRQARAVRFEASLLDRLRQKLGLQPRANLPLCCA